MGCATPTAVPTGLGELRDNPYANGSFLFMDNCGRVNEACACASVETLTGIHEDDLKTLPPL